MSRLKFLKLGRFIKFIFAISAMLLISLPVFADIRMAIPTVATISSVNLEQGATFRVTISYKNTTPNTVKIAAMKFYLKYDKDKLSIYNTRILTPVGLGYYFFQSGNYDFSYEVIDETAGKIQFGFVLKLGIPELEVAPNVEVPLLTLTFHVNKGAAVLDNQKLVWWWEEFDPGQNITNYVFVKELGAENVSGNIVTIDNYNVKAGAAPANFNGLDTAPKGLFDGDKAGTKPSVGNTITLDWATNAQTASDMTLYKNGLVRYHIYRSDKGAAPYVSFTLGDNDSCLFRDGAGNGTPTTGLNDGTAYTYKVTAVDNTDGGTTPDDLDFASSDPKGNDTNTQTITPTDTTPPVEVSGFAAASSDRALTLSWTNPANDDLGGVVIIRKDDGPVGPVTLTGADKTSFEHGDIVKEGDTLGGGIVIFAGNAMNNRGDTSKQRDRGGPAVLNTYADGGRENGKKYYYKVIAYDQIEGDTRGADLVQMGRNYSAGAVGEGVPGVPTGAPENFYALSKPEAGKISVFWDKPPEDYYGGVIILYTTDENVKWDWHEDWDTAKPELSEPTNVVDAGKSLKLMKEGKIGIFDITKSEPRKDPKVVEQESLEKSADCLGNPFDLKKAYFFNIVAYNKTAEDFVISKDFDAADAGRIASHRYSESRLAAAVPSLAGAGGTGKASGPVAFNFRVKRGLGINTFSIPFDTITSGPATAETLVKEINSKAGKIVVTIFGYWDNVNKEFVGGKVVYDESEKPVKAGEDNLSDIQLRKGIDYQVTIYGVGEEQTISITIGGEREFK